MVFLLHCCTKSRHHRLFLNRHPRLKKTIIFIVLYVGIMGLLCTLLLPYPTWDYKYNVTTHYAFNNKLSNLNIDDDDTFNPVQHPGFVYRIRKVLKERRLGEASYSWSKYRRKHTHLGT